jgi:hypothetical protein
MQNYARNTAEAEIKKYALKMQRAYTKKYREENPDKVKQWRANAVVNAYKKLVQSDASYFVDRGVINE